MVKLAQISFYCSSCGTTYKKWQGKCDSCNGWNTLEEDKFTQSAPKNSVAHKQSSRNALNQAQLHLVPINGDDIDPPRSLVGIHEFDRVLGGGIVSGSLILIGGDPGIGKSTLLIQTAAHVARKGQRCVYVSGEEAVSQIRMRARRLGLGDAPIELAAETNLGIILNGIKGQQKVDLLILDSIQTLWSEAIDSAPGTVSQLRGVVQDLVSFSKTYDISVILVGHVTKEGQIAGPRVVEHMVDTVLYFEGDRQHQYRLLRAVKNRFGAIDEIGVFEMIENGLSEVKNPSALFISEHNTQKSGSAIFAGIEGTRSLLTEIQALVVPAAYGTPRRSAVGWDSTRLAMILAILEARADMNFSGLDIFLNVVGGMKIIDPAADLAVACALTSSLLNIPLPNQTVFFGEISLSGDIRSVRLPEARLREAQKLGFSHAITPKLTLKSSFDIQISPMRDINNLVSFLKS
jgi:DNA repair protein RadA/Sms